MDVNGSVEGGTETDVKHARAQDEDASAESVNGDQDFHQRRNDYAAGRCTRHADSVGQRSTFVEIARSHDYPRCCRQSSSESFNNVNCHRSYHRDKHGNRIEKKKINSQIQYYILQDTGYKH